MGGERITDRPLEGPTPTLRQVAVGLHRSGPGPGPEAVLVMQADAAFHLWPDGVPTLDVRRAVLPGPGRRPPMNAFCACCRPDDELAR
ncbi:hypothetical protein T261_01611 [Streptomyces lydicus]|nr:hypothetical protein T261_01611 [Streptomyces lydicus]